MSTTTEGAPVTEGLPEERKKEKKNCRDRKTLTTGNSLRVHSFQPVDSRQNLEANQLN